ncbi:MAG: Rieske 2Fe-2S domain-containing protein [Acidimicrobiales bacterium]|nr:Rieske 2Fe-2S domain-containing protein [Acidimicrobiales bacterium]MCB1260062.1 Rieske 2Fe-2S domain-containing protein [Acidimicrobiales bacterium]
MSDILDQVVPHEDDNRYPFRMPYGWFQVAWSSELEPGAVVPRFYFGRHLVLWRDDDGEAHLNDAFCPHLGGHFGYGGKVVQRCQLQCPFHGWEFDAEGTNTRIPYSERTNTKARVRSYPVREIGDHMIVAWYHPHDEPPLFELDIPDEATSDEYSEWSTVHFAVDAASQELAENSVDGPHFRYVHNTEVVPEIESYETDGHVARMRSIQKFPTPRGVVDGRIDVDNQGPGFGITRFSGIVDTFLIGAAVPVDQNRCEVRFNFRTKKLGDAATTSTVGEAFVREVAKQFEEDRPIWENKAHLRRPALADTDPPFMKFRKWYSQFYADAVDGEHDVWAPVPPDVEFQPEFIPAEATASRKYRTTE